MEMTLTKEQELLVSHDELHIICQVAFSIFLDLELQPLLEEKLFEAKIQPGFAERAKQIEEKFYRERLRLMASGDIK